MVVQRRSARPTPALSLALLLLTATAAVLPLGRADIDPKDLDESYSRRIGDTTNCPNKIEIDTKGDPLIVKSGELEVLDQPCEGSGEFRLRLNPPASAADARRDTYLRAIEYLRRRSSAVGDVIAGNLTGSDVQCDVFTFPLGIKLIAVKPSQDVTVDFAQMFGANSPLTKARKTEELDDGTVYLFYGKNGDDCMYSETGVTDRVCFPASARATLRDGRTRALRDLRAGDEVAVGGPGAFSPVLGWTHRDAAAEYDFVRLATASGRNLTATRGHYVRTAHDGRLRQMRQVRVGMALTLADGSASRVVAKDAVRGVGLYNPQTAHGDIVVDGVVATTYTTAVKPHVAHLMLAPVRAAYCAAGRIGSSMLLSWA